MDQTSLDQHNWDKFGLLYPDVKVRAIRLYQDIYSNFNRSLRCTHSLRSIKEQNDLYEQGRSKPGAIVTRAKGLESPHNYGCAIDSCFNGLDPYLDKEDKDKATFLWNRYGSLAEAHGFKWGKAWHDLPHVELTYGLSIEELQDLYKIGGLRSVWTKFDQIRNIPVASEWKNRLESIQLLIGV